MFSDFEFSKTKQVISFVTKATEYRGPDQGTAYVRGRSIVYSP